MKTPLLRHCFWIFFLLLSVAGARAADTPKVTGRFLYVAVPGVRNYLEYGGHGVLVYDIDHGHRLVRRIASGGLDDAGKPSNVKGICASAATGRLYVSTIKSLQCYDLLSDKILWEKTYPGGCDRMSITPDGTTLYLPSFEGDHWNVVDASDGRVITQIKPNSRAHNTIVGPNGREAYLAGLGSSLVTVADVTSQRAARTVGPFAAAVRPFTINGRQTRLFANVNDLLGFEVADLKSGKVIQRVEVTGFSKGAVKRHGCPSHGIALTSDEHELWLADAHNTRVHIFDLTGGTPRQIESVLLRDQPGWITFSIDGRRAYPSTGEVIDVATRKIVATLADEIGAPVQSEKLLEIDFENGRVARAGDQFAIGGVR
jgi:DNA-binding beta-propeller fold protein YncE